MIEKSLVKYIETRNKEKNNLMNKDSLHRLYI